MCLSSIFELRTTLKDGVKSISLSIRQSKTAAAHVARVRGEEQETRYLARMEKRIGPTQNAQSAQHLISILACNQARRHWVYSGHYPRIFVTPKNTQNAETKHWSGADQCCVMHTHGEWIVWQFQYDPPYFQDDELNLSDLFPVFANVYNVKVTTFGQQRFLKCDCLH